MVSQGSSSMRTQPTIDLSTRHCIILYHIQFVHRGREAKPNKQPLACNKSWKTYTTNRGGRLCCVIIGNWRPSSGRSNLYRSGRSRIILRARGNNSCIILMLCALLSWFCISICSCIICISWFCIFRLTLVFSACALVCHAVVC